MNGKTMEYFMYSSNTSAFIYSLFADLNQVVYKSTVYTFCVFSPAGSKQSDRIFVMKQDHPIVIYYVLTQ